jgi:hypothetical protein
MSGDRFDREVYNVLTLNATVADILAVIKERVADLKIEFVDARIMNQLSYNVRSAKFEALGFAFQGDLGRGVRDTLDLLGNARAGFVATSS